MDWIPTKVTDTNYIPDARLKNMRASILVTYETLRGRRRYVKQVDCLYGRIQKKVGGEIVAWMFAPEPYKGM